MLLSKQLKHRRNSALLAKLKCFYYCWSHFWKLGQIRRQFRPLNIIQWLSVRLWTNHNHSDIHIRQSLICLIIAVFDSQNKFHNIFTMLNEFTDCRFTTVQREMKHMQLVWQWKGSWMMWPHLGKLVCLLVPLFSLNASLPARWRGYFWNLNKRAPCGTCNFSARMHPGKKQKQKWRCFFQNMLPQFPSSSSW